MEPNIQGSTIENTRQPVSPQPPHSLGWIKWVLIILVVFLFIPASLLLHALLIPFVFSFLYGSKTTKTGVKRIFFWLVINLMSSALSVLILQYTTRWACAIDGGPLCPITPTVIFEYLLQFLPVSILLGIPCLYLGVYVKHRNINTRRYIWVLVIIAVILLTSSAFYLFVQSQKQPIEPKTITVIPSPTPTPDPTANWKTYINSEYKFSIKYPEFVTYKEKVFNNVTFYYKTDEEDIPKNKYDLPSYYTKGLGILFRTGSAEEAASLELPNRPQEKVQINNSEGVKIKDSVFDYYLSSMGNDKSSLRLIYQGHIAYQTEDEIKERSHVYSQMLSTFKLLNQTDETADWKTLEGPHSTVQEPPYSFQYPETWISSTDVKDDPLKYQIFFESGKLLITKNLQLSDSNPQTVLKGAHISTFGQSNIFESNKSFDQNLADFDSNNNLSKEQLVKEERFTLNGQAARKRVKKSSNEGYIEVVFEYPKNKGYMYLTLVSSLNDFDQNQIIFDHILSTFTFLD